MQRQRRREEKESEAKERACLGFNLFSGTVNRRIYFGDAVDYVVELTGTELDLRVITSPGERYDVGQKVFVLVHPDRCVLVGER